MCFNWYPHVVAHMAAPETVRIVRFGGTPSADRVTGVRRFLARRAQASAAAMVACSWGVARQATLELGSPRLLCAGIPNAVYFQPDAEVGEPEWPRPYLISAGRLSPEKDHETLLRAFARVAPECEHDLVIAGEGPEERRIRDLVDELGLASRVHMVGYRSDIERWIAGAVLLVHSSTWEGFGNVIVEAMSMGVPVVVTDAPYGPREIMATVPAGLLVPTRDPDAFASAVLGLLRDDAERSRLGALGRDGIPRAYGRELLLTANEAVLNAVVAATSGGGG